MLLICAVLRDKCGFIDRNGHWIIHPQFDDAYPFSDNGLARVEINGKYGFIDKTGNFVINPQFDLAFIHEGIIFVCVFRGTGKHGYKNCKWGIIDKSGNIIAYPQFDSVVESLTTHKRERRH